MNRSDIAQQIVTTLGDHADDYNVDGIVEDLITNYDGNLNSIDDFESQSYWAIVESHDTSSQDEEPTTMAWLTLEAGCLIHGEGAEVGILDHSDEAVANEILAPVALPVAITEAQDDHKKAMDAAETRLTELGWDTFGAWDAVDTGYTITVSRALPEN